MMIDEEVIRKRIETQYKRRRAILFHIGLFALVNAILWTMYFLAQPYTQAKLLPILIITLLGTIIALATHITSYLLQNSLAAAKEQAVQHAIDDAIFEIYKEKPKHQASQGVSLSEDGELVYDIMDGNKNKESTLQQR